MVIFKNAEQLQEHIRQARQKGQVIGFAPTMGALHQGHISLIEASKKQTDVTVVSIFVNPAQFNDPADYNKYPVTTDKDIAILEQAGTDVLFLPGVQEIYPDGTGELEHYDLGYLETRLEGVYRPGHFQGVCQVMARLLNMVRTNHLFMGQKDYQQCMVVKRLLEIIGIDKVVELHICPTVREADGLAMSSRNVRLSPSARERAVGISAALSYLKEHLPPGDLSSLSEFGKKMLLDKQFTVDYFDIADADTLEPVMNWDGRRKLVALAAAFIDGVRLIDNMLIS